MLIHLFKTKVRKGNEDDENERMDKDEEGEEGGEQQKEQVEEEEGASRSHRAKGSNDGEREAFGTPYAEPEQTQIEERLQEGAQGHRASDGATLASGANNAHDVSSTEEVVNVQVTASPFQNSAVPVSPRDVVTTPRLALEHGTDAKRVIANGLVVHPANITRKQAEHAGLTTQHENDIEGAQSQHSDSVCDEDKIVVADGPQRGPRSDGGIIDPRTKDTLGTGVHRQDLMDANDSNSDVEEDSDGTSPRDNVPHHTMSDPEPRGLLPRTPVFQKLPGNAGKCQLISSSKRLVVRSTIFRIA
jgi:hypothetical protein